MFGIITIIFLPKKKATHRYTFGYKKAGILIALFNAALLLITIVCLLIESVFRIKTTPNLEGKTIAIIAIIGVFINGISAWFFISI
ncbi:MAG: cation transporter [Saprospirales bacterium]|nr:cation transporter [Saprospirales bacterium]